MHLLSFKHGNALSYGVAEDDCVVDVGSQLRHVYPTLRDALGRIEQVEAAVAGAPRIRLAEIEFLPPVWNSARIVCVGLNYKAHIAETGRDAPQHPILFPRYADSQVGHLQPMVRPRVSTQFDFEGELAVIIGKQGRHVSVADAMQYVAGYACFNDGSIRDYQRHTSQFMPGKCFWRSGSFGPWLVTRDAIADPGALRLQTRLNGEVMQDAGVDDLLFGIPQLVSYISDIWPLAVGDVIATGTPGGVGAFREPKVWMQPGDTVEVEITQLGTLSNSIVDE
ncbi:MAG: fumarylacetoacetate hydrolase family protein [Gammaproteobacteria bacterium]|nr:fumarylacetoacetate hydrolase family protein [Gammaproteobacteria bacterium]